MVHSEFGDGAQLLVEVGTYLIGKPGDCQSLNHGCILTSRIHG